MTQNIELYNYANNTENGEYWGHLMDIKFNVKYPLGRRDLVFFMITSACGNVPQFDSNGSPKFSVAVCNHTKGQSSKSKINLISRCLLRAEHGISKMESYLQVPPIESFLWDKDKANEPYAIRVLNKTVNNITVSNITHINSYLFNGFQSIEQVFDKKK